MPQYLNQMTCRSTTPYLAIWDADVIGVPDQIKAGINLLRKEKADMVFPYEKYFYSIPQPIKELYIRKGYQPDILVKSKEYMNPMVQWSVGGAFLVNRLSYMGAGMENERFYGWGPEDVERVVRWDTLGYQIRRIDGPLFHLPHPRKSWFSSKALEYNNRKELIRICRMSSKDLKSETISRSIERTGSSLKIGLAVIATGKYIEMALTMITSAHLYFFNGHQVRFFVFTDSDIPISDNLNRVPIDCEAWPLPTLKRYHYLYDNRHSLTGVDYLFLCDADMLFVDEVGPEILPDTFPFLVGTQHPGVHNDWQKANKRGTYETNPLSKAYVSSTEGDVYYAGAFNGGRLEEFLKMAETIKNAIDTDLSVNYMAKWHDESHINRYYIDHPPKLLPPDYCYPESWNLPFKKKLLALDKTML